MCVSLHDTFFPPLHPALFLFYFSPIASDFRFNPRHYVNNTDTFIRGQNSFALHFDRTLYLPRSSTLHPFSPLPPSTHPSFLSHGCFQTDPQPMCTRCPPPQNSTPSLLACHCSLLCSIQTDGIAISTGFSLCLSLPLSPTLHAVYFVFLFLIPYQVKNK